MILHILFLLVAITGLIVAFSGVLKFMRLQDAPPILRLKMVDQTARFSVEKEGMYVFGVDEVMVRRAGILFRTRIWSVDSSTDLPNYILPEINSGLGYTSDSFFSLNLYAITKAGDYYIELYGTENTKMYRRFVGLVENKVLSLVIKLAIPIRSKIKALLTIIIAAIIMLFGIILSVNPFLFN